MNRRSVKWLVQALVIAALLFGAHLIIARHELAMSGAPMPGGHSMGH
ncbi:MAG TPA: hypothetical protein VFY73_21135 [Ideonella sp.]|nr:hypothetical protein [Ideonella sp.]HEX5686541.1 hypothetical protein [Ideonella sp.]